MPFLFFHFCRQGFGPVDLAEEFFISAADLLMCAQPVHYNKPCVAIGAKPNLYCEALPWSRGGLVIVCGTFWADLLRYQGAAAPPLIQGHEELGK